MIIYKYEKDKFTLQTPYLPELPGKFRAVGGKWDGRAWVFENDPDVIEAVNKIVEKYFNTPIFCDKRATVKLTALDDISEWHGPVTAGGYVLANARGRDSGATVGDGVVLLDGTIDSSGSVKNWRSKVFKGAAFKIKNFPLCWEFDPGWFELEIIEESAENPLAHYSTEELLAEIERRKND